jgi:hypothetical protein
MWRSSTVAIHCDNQAEHKNKLCVLSAVRRVTHTLHCTQYTHHNLKHVLPQHCKTYNDVFLLINSTKV